MATSNYNQQLQSAYQMMSSAPMQMQRNSTGGVNANVMGMSGYGDSNYGWTRPNTNAVNTADNRTNAAAQGFGTSNLGQNNFTQDFKPPAYTGAQNKGTWWDNAYQDIKNWSITEDQKNPDRGIYQDAFQMNMAEKGYDFELTKAMNNEMAGHERGMMTLSADLDRRNTMDLMGAEHGWKIAGMETQQRLGKDYLAAETDSTVRIGQEQGLQQRLGQKESGYQERETEAEKGFQQRAGYRVQGQENREGTRVTGQEDRLKIRTTGDETRRALSHDRDTAMRGAVAMNRR
jgi:hypothetical protein